MLKKMAVAVLASVGLLVASSCAAPAGANQSTQTAVVGSRVGDLAPDFILTDVGGKTVRLSDLRGKPILVNFWASW